MNISACQTADLWSWCKFQTSIFFTRPHFSLYFFLSSAFHFPSNSVFFSPLSFRGQALWLAKPARIAFRCQIKCPWQAASRQSNISGTLCVVSFGGEGHKIPPPALDQTQGLKLKGHYAAGLRGLFGFVQTAVGCGLPFHLHSGEFLTCVFVWVLKSPGRRRRMKKKKKRPHFKRGAIFFAPTCVWI